MFVYGTPSIMDSASVNSSTASSTGPRTARETSDWNCSRSLVTTDDNRYSSSAPGRGVSETLLSLPAARLRAASA